MIPQVVIDKFNSLPKKGKPLVRTNNVPEWTTLAGLVLTSTMDDSSTCVCLCTGVKATPDEKLSCSNGFLLHDMHAEILVLRAFNVFLVEEGKKAESEYVETLESGKRRLKPHFKVSLWISELPCGDSSMECIQDNADDDWGAAPQDCVLRGREYYTTTGRVRTKPGRRDSPMTLSKSCSDKLAMKQYTGVVMGVVERVFEQVYLDELVVPAGNDIGIKRAFRDRLEQGIKRTLDGEEVESTAPKPRYFDTITTDTTFAYSQEPGRKPSASSIIWTINTGNEVVLNGVKMGHKPTNMNPQSASKVSRQAIWMATKPLLKDSQFDDYYSAKCCVGRTEKIQMGHTALHAWHCTCKDNFRLSGDNEKETGDI
ncbi:YALIA101S01e05204g1_1 [Yarrowia lipolytica]|nr:tRNA-specific adenosine deaminase 1 [Yarrowia lipolytica]SEI30686.1 YALIA101S01e05204g1_1 [Yarrowia lipolytica]